MCLGAHEEESPFKTDRKQLRDAIETIFSAVEVNYHKLQWKILTFLDIFRLNSNLIVFAKNVAAPFWSSISSTWRFWTINQNMLGSLKVDRI